MAFSGKQSITPENEQSVIFFEHQNHHLSDIRKNRFEFLVEIDDKVVGEFGVANPIFGTMVNPGKHKFLLRDKNGDLAKSNVLFIETRPTENITIYSRLKGVYSMLISHKIRCANWEISLSPIPSITSDIVPKIMRIKNRVL